MAWVKICGITNLEDARVAVEAGADALGFVFYEKSPRNVDPETVREIVRQLPSAVEKVGVFAEIPMLQAVEIVRHANLTALQFHLPLDGNASLCENCAYGFELGDKRIYLSFPASGLLEGQINVDFSSFAIPMLDDGSGKIRENPFRTVFLDSGTAQQPGGTGKAFDWARAAPLAAEMKRHVNVVVAGGMTPGNVGEALRILKPWGVDVVSGVEASPGKKDPDKVRAFIAAVRQADKSA
jgi:phosphoribosylanthranilate isomerase